MKKSLSSCLDWEWDPYKLLSQQKVIDWHLLPPHSPPPKKKKKVVGTELQALKPLHCFGSAKADCFSAWQLIIVHKLLAVIVAILMQTSAEQVPSLHGVAPRYVKLVISTNFWPFMIISALMLFVLLVMILLFPVLSFHMLLLCLQVCCWGPGAHHYCCH